MSFARKTENNSLKSLAVLSLLTIVGCQSNMNRDGVSGFYSGYPAPVPFEQVEGSDAEIPIVEVDRKQKTNTVAQNSEADLSRSPASIEITEIEKYEITPIAETSEIPLEGSETENATVGSVTSNSGNGDSGSGLSMSDNTAASQQNSRAIASTPSSTETASTSAAAATSTPSPETSPSATTTGTADTQGALGSTTETIESTSNATFERGAGFSWTIIGWVALIVLALTWFIRSRTRHSASAT